MVNCHSYKRMYIIKCSMASFEADVRPTDATCIHPRLTQPTSLLSLSCSLTPRLSVSVSVSLPLSVHRDNQHLACMALPAATVAAADASREL